MLSFMAEYSRAFLSLFMLLLNDFLMFLAGYIQLCALNPVSEQHSVF